jgi:hypothetical protein
MASGMAGSSIGTTGNLAQPSMNSSASLAIDSYLARRDVKEFLQALRADF